MNILSIHILLLLLAMMLWGSTFPALKFVLQVYDPFWVTFVRLSIGSLVFVLLRKRWGEFQYRKGDWKWMLLLALFEPCCYFLFETQALRFTSASEAAIITALFPITVTGGAWLFFHERISLRKTIGLVIAVGGVMLLTAYGLPTEQSPNPVLGNLLQCGAVLCGTGYALSVKNLGRRYPVFFLTAVQVMIGAGFYLIFLVFPFVETPATYNRDAVLVLVYLGVFCSGFPYFLYSLCITKLSAYTVSMGTNLIPVFGLLLGWLLLGETLTFMQYAAILVIFTGIFLGSDMWGYRGRKPQF